MNSQNLQPLFNVSPKQLPVKFRALLEPSAPLNLPHFSPISVTVPYWGAVFFIGLANVIVLFGSLRASRKYGEFSPESFANQIPSLIFVFLGLLAALILASRKQWIANRINSGKLRLGIIFHPEAIIVRLRKNSCYLLPRDFLKSGIVDTYLHARGTRAVKITFIDYAGIPHTNIVGINSFGIFDFLMPDENLMATLNRWKSDNAPDVRQNQLRAIARNAPCFESV